MLSMKVIAAITNDSAATGVLASAAAISSLFSASVEALHVGAENAAVAQTAQSAGVALRTVAGRASEVIAQAASGEDVAAIVIGTRGSPASRPTTGSTTTALVTLLDKPIVVVPPNTTVEHDIERVLVPLDGTAASTAALQEIMELASAAEVEIVVAHIYEQRSLPAFSDQLPHEVRAWREEFIARHCPAVVDANLELRVGEPREHLLDILRASRCKLVALGWSQNLTGGHAAVVRQMLAESPVPVLLMPTSRKTARRRLHQGLSKMSPR
jgi:nucleotide-binding universal stress UspA family protein